MKSGSLKNFITTAVIDRLIYFMRVVLFTNLLTVEKCSTPQERLLIVALQAISDHYSPLLAAIPV